MAASASASAPLLILLSCLLCAQSFTPQPSAWMRTTTTHPRRTHVLKPVLLMATQDQPQPLSSDGEGAAPAPVPVLEAQAEAQPEPEAVPSPPASDAFDYKIGDKYTAKVTKAFKFGVFASIEGAVRKQDVLLPRSFLSPAQYRSLSEQIGTTVEVELTNVHAENKTISATLTTKDHTPREPRSNTRNLSSIVDADRTKMYKGKTVGSQNFGIFVELDEFPGVHGLLPYKLVPSRVVSEWRNNYQDGKELNVMINEIDAAAGRLTFSMMHERRKDVSELQGVDPGKEFEATITEIVQFGVFLSIKEVDMGGLLHRNDMPSSIGTGELAQTFKVGETVKVNIVSVDKDNRRLGLRLVTSAAEYMDKFRQIRQSRNTQTNKVSKRTFDDYDDEDVEERRIKKLKAKYELQVEVGDRTELKRQMDKEIEQEKRQKDARSIERIKQEARESAKEAELQRGDAAIPTTRVPTAVSAIPYAVLQEMFQGMKVEDIPEEEREKSIIPYVLRGEDLPSWALWTEEQADIKFVAPQEEAAEHIPEEVIVAEEEQLVMVDDESVDAGVV